MNRPKKTIIIFLALLIFLIVALNTELFHSVITGNIESITNLLGDNIPYTLLITLVIMFVHNAFPVIPLFIVIMINNTLFGFQFGVVWSILTSIFCAVTVFLGVRYILQDLVMKKINSPIFSKVEHKGLWFVLGARVFPFTPTSIVNGVSGVSNIRLSYFTIATALGNFILFIIYTLIQDGLISQGINQYIIGIFILTGSILFYYLKKLSLRKKGL